MNSDTQVTTPWWTSPAFFRSLPFAVFIALLALRGQAQAGGFDGSALYAAQAGVTGLILLAFVGGGRYVELWSAPVSVRAWIVTLAVGIAIFALWIHATLPWMRMSEPAASFSGRDDNGELRTLVIAVRYLGAALVVPLMEELFWRSFLMRWLDRRDFLSLAPGQVSLYALIASSAVFALAHDLWLAGFIAGLAYGELYRRTGNLWYPIAAHALTNAVLGGWVIATEQWRFW